MKQAGEEKEGEGRRRENRRGREERRAGEGEGKVGEHKRREGIRQPLMSTLDPEPEPSCPGPCPESAVKRAGNTLSLGSQHMLYSGDFEYILVG